jgi:hypothetical protein
MNTDTLISGGAFIVLTLLWLAFAAALFLNPELLGRAWRMFRSWNVLVQLLVGLLVLPVVVGLWVWQNRWPAWLRLVLVAGLAWVTVFTFFPRSLFG